MDNSFIYIYIYIYWLKKKRGGDHGPFGPNVTLALHLGQIGTKLIMKELYSNP